MNYKEGLQKISELISIAEFGVIQRDKKIIETYQSYGSGDDRINFSGRENVIKLLETYDFFWKADKEIHQSLSRKTIDEHVIRIIREAHFEGTPPTDQTIKELITTLKAIPKEQHEVIYDLYGVNFYAAQPLEFGPFKIYNRDIHKQFLLDTYPHGDMLLSLHEEDEGASEVYISTFVEARDQARAIEKATNNFKQFEDIIRFMIGDLDVNYDIGIFNFNGFRRTECLIFSPKYAGSTSKTSGTPRKINIHQFPINDTQYGHDKIWNILSKSNPSDLEKRIISAIGWVGKGIRDEEPTRSFTQLMFALEALFQFQQKNVFISPSITSQISEFAAFIIGEDYDHRVLIESVIKDLYGKRSAIVHGGSNEISSSNRYEALHIIKNLIHNLLMHEELSQLQTIQQLNEWAKRQKYTLPDQNRQE